MDRADRRQRRLRDVAWRFTNIGQPANGIAADIVRIEDSRLAEHWDVIQDEATREESKSAPPMFKAEFPS
jgi:predicted SnoaL-like aldol condensation-catalyzing enzyme